jgi:hypothetical protein
VISSSKTLITTYKMTKHQNSEDMISIFTAMRTSYLLNFWELRYWMYKYNPLEQWKTPCQNGVLLILY